MNFSSSNPSFWSLWWTTTSHHTQISPGSSYYTGSELGIPIANISLLVLSTTSTLRKTEWSESLLNNLGSKENSTLLRNVIRFTKFINNNWEEHSYISHLSKSSLWIWSLSLFWLEVCEPTNSSSKKLIYFERDITRKKIKLNLNKEKYKNMLDIPNVWNKCLLSKEMQIHRRWSSEDLIPRPEVA